MIKKIICIMIMLIFVGGILNGKVLAKEGREDFLIKKEKDDFKAIGVEAAASPIITEGKKGSHKIQGISPGFIADTLDLDVIDEVVTVEDEDAGKTTIALAQKEGILAGISSGSAVYAALEIAKRPENKGKTIVAVLADTGERYLSVEWLSDLYY